ncbi:hypothetical protein CA830_22990, partial [Burkholderia multivorans]
MCAYTGSDHAAAVFLRERAAAARRWHDRFGARVDGGLPCVDVAARSACVRCFGSKEGRDRAGTNGIDDADQANCAGAADVWIDMSQSDPFGER